MLAFSAGVAQAQAADLDSYQEGARALHQETRIRPGGSRLRCQEVHGGKTIFSIPVSSGQSLHQEHRDGDEHVAKDVGFKFVEWQNQGQVSQWAQGMDQATNRRPT